jgi:hypothetical protein
MGKQQKRTVRLCLYCGSKVSKGKKGEHIVPEVIGGELTLKKFAGKWVCIECNTGELANVDRELCSRSHLSIVASQEIASHLWQMWDIDHGAGNLLVEAKPDWEERELKRIYHYPQIIFDGAVRQMRGDAEEMERMGREAFEEVLNTAVRSAFQRYSHGMKGAINLERVRNDLVANGYRLPPRIHSQHSIFEIARKVNSQSFTMRFNDEGELRKAFLELSRMENPRRRAFTRYSVVSSSRIPTLSLYFDTGMALRGMLKIAVNLVAAFCRHTTIDYKTCPHVFNMVLGNTHVNERDIAANGFVHADDIQDIAQPGCHSFRITSIGNLWAVFSSYFGGRIGTAVTFQGPNHEDWGTMDIVSPIRSKIWCVSSLNICHPMKVRINWVDSRAITPTLRNQSERSKMVVEPVREKRKTNSRAEKGTQ